MRWGNLRALHTAHGMVGLLAVAPGPDRLDHRGCHQQKRSGVRGAPEGRSGFAAAGQVPGPPRSNPSVQWLIGTIDRLNTAS